MKGIACNESVITNGLFVYNKIMSEIWGDIVVSLVLISRIKGDGRDFN